ncbi:MULTISPECIES: hypothetical protein [unclassified Leptospira]|uniref:hypothetical protein n=1 Tax=unclassified Leptospira TaxID=2633828 RepID=UPI0012F67525|nr:MULTISPECIES: hypothetical protein [unclassified Leptospira]MCR1794666.1 hypothetical protein [Leptospira sp. id769339]
MNKRILILAISIYGISCMPTNERTACLYNLQEKGGPFDASDDSCNVIGADIAGTNSTDPDVRITAAQFLNFHLAKCLEYHQELKECKKEINYYIPTLHPQSDWIRGSQIENPRRGGSGRRV